MKYPLLLQQLRNLTDERSEEHQHLIGEFLISSAFNLNKQVIFPIINLKLHYKLVNTIFDQITEALKGMEKVAEHINEMQRIHEEYGAIFDHLFRQHQKSCKQVKINAII